MTIDLRSVICYLRLPPEKRSLIHEIIKSRVGLHNESFRFAEDGLCTIHNADFTESARFQRAYAAGEATNSWAGWPLRWRAYIVCWCAEWASGVPGDFVECGVNKGGNARMIIEYIGMQGGLRNFYLLDTFNGFSEELLSIEEKYRAVPSYHYSDCLAEVKKTFSSYPFVKIIPGIVPTTLTEIQAKEIAFLSIDMNCVAPEIQAITFLWDRISPGGVVVLDDYGFSKHYLQKEAFDRFALTKNITIMSLPTGQGLIFKSFSTASRI